MGVRALVRTLVGGSGDERDLKAWRARNRDRLLAEAPAIEGPAQALLSDLETDGFARGRFEELFGSIELFDDLERDARRLYDAHKAGVAAGEEVADDKGYLASLLPRTLKADDPFARVALHPDVLAVANSYLGMRSLLRSVELWLTVPTEGPARETQLWHRDGDDVMNVKFYVCFTDVTREAGPFCYAPRTHPLGERRELPERDEKGRSTDDQVRAIVPEDEWVYGTGARGTVMFADTSGYHKQSKPTSAERLMLMVQYTSGTPNYPPATEIRGVDRGGLSDEQRAALSP